MRYRYEKEPELDTFTRKAIVKARALAGPLLEIEDLEQAAELAVLEAEAVISRTAPGDRLRFLRGRIVDALKKEVRIFGKESSEPVNLERLLDEDDDDSQEHIWPALSLVWDGETSDEAVSKHEVTAHVREVVDGMPPETAQIVRLCFGLDGGDIIDPIDVADVLDETPETVLSHLWAAEKLFRHFSADGLHRRLTPMTDLEFQAFYHVGDLSWYDLRDLNLNNADLRNCDLSYAILSGMNLWGLVMDGAKACGVNLWGAQLDGAKLAGADLSGANLERAGVRGADLSHTVLPGSNLWGADLSGSGLDHANLADSDLRSSDLTGANLTRANLNGADLRGADLRHAKLVGAELVGANLQRADLAGVDMRWANLRNSDLCWSNVALADLRGASMQGAIRSPKLTGMYLNKAPRPRRLRPVANAASPVASGADRVAGAASPVADPASPAIAG